MGAQNVKRAYAVWAGKVPPLSMQLLVYMALISKDSDTEPWFGQGHGALAEHALGRVVPIVEKDIRAVERAIAPLLKEGAIVADRRPAPRSGGPRTVRYRLVLPGGDLPRIAVDDGPDVPRNPVGERPTVSGGDVPRNPAERPTESDETSHGIRGTEEKEDPRGLERGVSQSARTREALRWLRKAQRLTDADAAIAWEAAQARARGPIKHPIPYLQKMIERGHLADIMMAIWDKADAEANDAGPQDPPPLRAIDGTATASGPTGQQPSLFPHAVRDGDHPAPEPSPAEEPPRDLGLPAAVVRTALDQLTMHGWPYRAAAARYYATRDIDATEDQVDAYGLQLAWGSAKDRDTLRRHPGVAAALGRTG